MRRAAWWSLWLALGLTLAACGATARPPSWASQFQNGAPDLTLTIDIARMRSDPIYGPVVELAFAKVPGPGRALARASSVEMVAGVTPGHIASWVAVIRGVDDEGARAFALRETGTNIRVRRLGASVVMSESSEAVASTLTEGDVGDAPRLPGDAVLLVVLRGRALAPAAFTRGRKTADYLAAWRDLERAEGLLYTAPSRRFVMRAIYANRDAADRAEIAMLRARRDFAAPGKRYAGIFAVDVRRDGRAVDVEITVSPSFAAFVARVLK